MNTGATVLAVSALDEAPLANALQAWSARRIDALHTPGHKGRWRPPGMQAWLTTRGAACDLPAMDATGNWFAAEGPVVEAERRYARACGAAETRFLVNGSTGGVHAMLLASVGENDVVLLSRHAHLSVFSGLVLTGAQPVYLRAEWSPAAGPLPPTLDEIAHALEAHPRTRAVFITSPSYYGLGRSLASVAELCRRRGVLLLVDEAHGAHLPFLPKGYLPSAISQGADLVVQSAHKTLGSLVGTAVIHRPNGSRVGAERLQAALKLVSSTSPSYLLMASLDLCRQWLEGPGAPALAAAADRATTLREEINRLRPLIALTPERATALGDCQIDPLRLMVNVAAAGLSGYEFERRLLEKYRLLGEFADRDNVAFVLGPFDSARTWTRLLRALRRLAAECKGREQKTPSAEILSIPAPVVAMTPREAFRRPAVTVKQAEATGRIAAETICQYPPGIPLIVQGELITDNVIAACAEGVRCGYHVTAMDSTLVTLRVLEGRGRPSKRSGRRNLIPL